MRICADFASCDVVTRIAVTKSTRSPDTVSTPSVSIESAKTQYAISTDAFTAAPSLLKNVLPAACAGAGLRRPKSLSFQGLGFAGFRV
jgi:hypothetical protein